MKNKLLCLLLALVLLVSLVGCHEEPKPTTPPTTEPSTEPATLPPTTAPTEPELTAERLLVQMAAAVDGRSPTQMNASLDLDLGIKMKMDGFSLSMGASMELDMKTMISEDPYAMYADFSVKAESMNQTQVQKAEAYYLIEDGKFVCYVYDKTLNMWTRTEIGEVPESNPSGGESSGADLPPLEMTLEENTQKLNRREVYVLRCLLTRDHLTQFMTPMAPITGTLITPLDNSTAELPEDLQAETVIYVDTESLLPVRIQIDILGIEDMLNDLLTGSLTPPATELSLVSNIAEKKESDSPFHIGVNTFRIVLDELYFDPAEIPAVPQEAYDYLKMADHDPLQPDGSFILVHTGAAARITPPENWTVWDTGFYWLYIDHDEQPINCAYNMHSGMTRQQIQQLVLSESVVPMREQKLLDSYAYGNRIGKFDTMYAQTTYGVTIYYAWAPMSDGWLVITVQDESGMDMYELLIPLVEAVEHCDPLY